MRTDFLGTDKDNYIVGEDVVIDSNCILLKRGFFFSDSVILYDGDGNEMDKNGYSFDLPVPDISCRTGRMIFGRILLNTRAKPVTIDYRTPHYEDDSRYQDIKIYHAYSTKGESFDYYSNVSGLFQTGVNEMENSTVSDWLSGLDQLISIWRSRNLDYDLIIDHIDQVFTRGVVRNPNKAEIDNLLSPMFITTTEGGNSLDLQRWSIDWRIDSNRFTIDYDVMRDELDKSVTSAERGLVNKFSGDIPKILADLDKVTLSSAPIKSFGDNDDSLIISDGDIIIDSKDFPNYYSGLYEKISETTDKAVKLLTMCENITNVDGEYISQLSKYLLPKLNVGYGVDNISISGQAVVVDGVVLDKIYTREHFVKDISAITFDGPPATKDNLDIIKRKYEALGSDVVVSTIKSEYSHLGESLASILDSLSIVRETMDHGTTNELSLEELL